MSPIPSLRYCGPALLPISLKSWWMLITPAVRSLLLRPAPRAQPVQRLRVQQGPRPVLQHLAAPRHQKSRNSSRIYFRWPPFVRPFSLLKLKHFSLVAVSIASTGGSYVSGNSYRVFVSVTDAPPLANGYSFHPAGHCRG